MSRNEISAYIHTVYIIRDRYIRIVNGCFASSIHCHLCNPICMYIFSTWHVRDNVPYQHDWPRYELIHFDWLLRGNWFMNFINVLVAHMSVYVGSYTSICMYWVLIESLFATHFFIWQSKILKTIQLQCSEYWTPWITSRVIGCSKWWRGTLNYHISLSSDTSLF